MCVCVCVQRDNYLVYAQGLLRKLAEFEGTIYVYRVFLAARSLWTNDFPAR